MKFPILKNHTTEFPDVARCLQCKKRKVLEPHSMAILSGGAMLMDGRRLNGGPDERMDAFLKLTWHGAHDSGIGEDWDIYTQAHFAEDCRGGQFEVYFCSTACLRACLNSWVDALEAKIQSERWPVKRPKSPNTALQRMGSAVTPPAANRQPPSAPAGRRRARSARR